MKNAPTVSVLETAIQLKEICNKYEALLIINDDPLIAKRVDANGVQLGKSDMPI
jgi:thiamine-phosphate pyrophosphorylase